MASARQDVSQLGYTGAAKERLCGAGTGLSTGASEASEIRAGELHEHIGKGEGGTRGQAQCLPCPGGRIEGTSLQT